MNCADEEVKCGDVCVDLKTSVDNCGECAKKCDGASNADATCADSACGLACTTGFGNCDMDAVNGCEATLGTDLMNCGACGNACALANATPACAAGMCGIGQCNADFDNCDMNATNGCEANLNADLENCGACGTKCGAGQVCATGVCQKPAVVSAIATGFDHSCALVNGAAKCWGEGSLGELGNGASADSLTPVDVMNLTGLNALAAGVSFGCGLKSDGTAFCWGSNAYGGKLGAGSADDSSNVALQVKDLAGIETIGASFGHACASTKTKEVFCWGTNGFGQLGTGGGPTNVPVKVPAASLPTQRAISVAAGSFHTCAAFENGDVYCWGRNDFGQVGVTAGGDQPAPQKVTLPALAEEVTTGELHSCARLADKSVYCWGYGGGGELGNGGFVSSATPVKVTGIANALRIGAGWYHNCAVLEDNTATCWGENEKGQLGNGGAKSNVPVAVAGLMGAAQIDGGRSHTCARLTTGGVRCWGDNAAGQLGNNLTTNSSTPVIPVGFD